MTLFGFAPGLLPFIFGAGTMVMVLEYEDSYPFWFAGIRSDLSQ